ncbi:SDR family oxidoreductase [Caenispirillum salinarum]|uniref:SDR family oxidoreductase n=1 Tax=Caenispirillum salinarum TaxID=859058 RepID=UPI00384D33FE
MAETPLPKQQQDQPGTRDEMTPKPRAEMTGYKGAAKLEGLRALVTGGDSGIGRATAIGFAKEGADVFIAYKEEHADAEETARLVRETGRACHLKAGDIGAEAFCHDLVDEAIAALGGLDILVNNAGEQHSVGSFDEITHEQVERTFHTNVISMFDIIKAALPALRDSAKAGRRPSIINSTSVTAYRGSGHLIDYAATKGAITALTRSLAKNLADEGIRVNGVAPGPVWTPLIPASFDPDHLQHFGEKTAMGRPGEPDEVAPSYIFLASGDAAFMTGQVLHPNGGEVVNT